MPTFDESTPYGGDNKVSCFIGGCKAKCSSYHSLMQHVKIAHKKKQSDYKETFFHKKFREEEMIKRKRKADTQDDVAVQRGENETREQQLPRVTGKRKAKKRCVDSIAEPRPQPTPIVSCENTNNAGNSCLASSVALLSTLDGKASTALDNGDIKMFEYLFEKAGTLRAQLQGNFSQQNNGIGTASKTIAQPIAVDADPAHGSSRTGAPLLQVKIRSDAENYKKPSDDELSMDLTRRRFSWPCKFTNDIIDLVELEQYINQATRKTNTAVAYIGGVKQFFSLFEMDGGPHDPLDVFKVIYSTKLIHNIMGKDVLHPMLSTTRKIRDGLRMLCDFMMLTGEDRDDSLAVKYASACKVRFINPLKGKLADAKEHQRIRREDIDKGRIANLPKAANRNDIVRRAMLELLIVCNAFAETFKTMSTIPRIVRRFINTVAYGVAAYRTFLGRPGEWKRMLRAIIQTCLDNEDSIMVLITDHKTVRTSGKLGRYMPADVKWTFRKLIEFATPSKTLLFEPVGRAECIQLHALGYDFASMYTPGCEPPEPTLMRKDCETAVANPDNAELTKRMDERVGSSDISDRMSSRTAAMSGHGSKCQGKYYNLNDEDPKRHVASAEAYIEIFIGPVVDIPVIPDAGEHEPRTAEAILEEFRIATGRNREAQSDDVSDAGNFSDEDIADDDVEDEAEDSEDDAAQKNKPLSKAKMKAAAKSAASCQADTKAAKKTAAVAKALGLKKKATPPCRRLKYSDTNTIADASAQPHQVENEMVALLDSHCDRPLFQERIVQCTTAINDPKIKAAVEAAEQDAKRDDRSEASHSARASSSSVMTVQPEEGCAIVATPKVKTECAGAPVIQKRKRGPRITIAQQEWIKSEHDTYINSKEGSVAKYSSGYADRKWFDDALLRGQAENIFTEDNKAEALRSTIRESISKSSV